MTNFQFSMKKYKSKIHNSLFIILFLVAFLERVVFDLGPNIELVTAAMILSSFYLGQRQTLWLVLLIMVSTDLVLGNTSIFIFTWSGFLIPAIFASDALKQFKKLITNHLPAQAGQSRITKKIFNTFSLITIGVSSNIFFYLWTNFGVWLLDSWGMYSNDLSGLLMSYINGLPFLKMQMISTLIFVPTGFFLTEAALSLSKNFKLLSRLEKKLI